MSIINLTILGGLKAGEYHHFFRFFRLCWLTSLKCASFPPSDVCGGSKGHLFLFPWQLWPGTSGHLDFVKFKLDVGAHSNSLAPLVAIYVVLQNSDFFIPIWCILMNENELNWFWSLYTFTFSIVWIETIQRRLDGVYWADVRVPMCCYRWFQPPLHESN